MKQLIIMVAMIMLGIAISGIISDFGDSATSMATKTTANLDAVIADIPTPTSGE